MTPFPRPRWYRDQFGDLWIDGQFYMGRMRVPSMPPRIALTDRTTGAVRVLSDDGAGTVVLAVVNSAWRDVIKYKPYEGPHYGDWKLYLNSGQLAFERDPGYNSAKILTRRNFATSVLEIKASTTGSVVTSPYDL